MNSPMKYEFKGTPGVWNILGTLDFIDGPDDQNISDEGRHSICKVFGPDAKANQMLIAASPLLLSALIKAVEHADSISMAASILNDNDIDTLPYDLPYWYDEAKSAIEAALNLKTVQP